MSTRNNTISPFERKAHIIELQKSLIANEMWQTCANCEDFEISSGMCARYKAKPPADIIVVGCTEHCPQIPF